MTIGNKKFPVSLTSLYEMLDFVMHYVEMAGFDQSSAFKIEVSTEEALVNIIKYSGLSYEDTLEIQCKLLKSEGLQITIQDPGKLYDPFENVKPPTDIRIPIEERLPGGFGIYLITQLMDHAEYKQIKNKNIIILTKYLN